ncbi:hypothetical protein FB451DRAFT_1174641 [Mycena latifolia]|nr:hypothetical protein FB451DRAFT_1174641 [Mycena latifolia]
MAPKFIAARDVDSSSTSSAVPTPTSSTSSESGSAAQIPGWVGYIAIAVLACILLFVLYFAIARPRSGSKQRVSLYNSDSKTKSASSSNETLVNGLGEIPAIAEPAAAYTAAADNAAPGAEDALFHRTRPNTVKNQRRAVQSAGQVGKEHGVTNAH